MDQRSKNVQDSYDQVAEEYTARIFHELEQKSLDQELLDDFARAMQGAGPVVEVGCGPGHVTRYLHERGVTISGLDLSARMVAIAQQMSPEITFEQGDMAALQVEENAWAGCVAFYSLIHFPPERLVPVLRELHRLLKPGDCSSSPSNRGARSATSTNGGANQLCSSASSLNGRK